MVALSDGATSQEFEAPTSNRPTPVGGSPYPLAGLPSIGRVPPTSSHVGKVNVVAGVIVPPLFLAASFFGATTDASPTLIAHEYSTFNRLIAGGGNREATDSPAEPLENTEDVTKNDISRSLNYIHETSGLTWEEIAYLLGVSRRAVHNWINGSRVSSKNARNLAGLHRLIQKVDQGDRESTRAHLLAPRDNGTTLYEAAMVAGRADRSHLDLALDPVTRIAVADD